MHAESAFCLIGPGMREGQAATAGRLVKAEIGRAELRYTVHAGRRCTRFNSRWAAQPMAQVGCAAAAAATLARVHTEGADGADRV